MTNFEFVTNDRPEAVISYYKNAMSKTYGFVGEVTESPSSDVTILHFARKALRDRWVIELVTLKVTSEGTGPTTVNVDLQVNPAP